MEHGTRGNGQSKRIERKGGQARRETPRFTFFVAFCVLCLVAVSSRACVSSFLVADPRRCFCRCRSTRRSAVGVAV